MTTTVPLTGWQFTDAVRQVGCSKCGAKAGDHCRQPKGRKAWPPHSERTVAVAEKFGIDTWRGSPDESGAARVARINEEHRAILRVIEG